jgi:medium-chain acyl-[acyl-carrier-protein] hydrolase
LLNTPLTVFAGRHDEHVLIEHVEEWGRETSGNFRMCWFDGGHFFINSERQAVLAELNADLAKLTHY